MISLLFGVALAQEPSVGNVTVEGDANVTSFGPAAQLALAIAGVLFAVTPVLTRWVVQRTTSPMPKEQVQELSNQTLLLGEIRGEVRNTRREVHYLRRRQERHSEAIALQMHRSGLAKAAQRFEMDLGALQKEEILTTPDAETFQSAEPRKEGP